MLSDPIQIVDASDLSTTISGISTVTDFALIPNGANGTTKRVHVVDDEVTTLSISRSESKENAPYVTNRTVQRLDFQKVDPSGKKVVLSCYVVVAAPLSDLFTTAMIKKHVMSACLFAAFGGNNANTLVINPNNDHLDRVLQGEG
uniref:Uncharacterized protein n=1 Tax=Leviviridae sp. TaxID=2027243 RepID=A0A514D1S2_9VIRU|nr:MAG: hypothetical protein H2Bulk35297_000002 [Leviviridae sp.]